MKHQELRLETITIVEGKVRKHRFEGIDPSHCAKCGKQFASVSHK